MKYGIGKTPKWFIKGFSWKEFKGPTNTEGFSSKYQTKLLLKILRYFLPDQDPMTNYENYPEEEDSDFNRPTKKKRRVSVYKILSKSVSKRSYGKRLGKKTEEK